MTSYNVVKYCGMCKVRYVLKNTSVQRAFCPACQAKRDEYYRNEGEAS